MQCVTPQARLPSIIFSIFLAVLSLAYSYHVPFGLSFHCSLCRDSTVQQLLIPTTLPLTLCRRDWAMFFQMCANPWHVFYLFRFRAVKIDPEQS